MRSITTSIILFAGLCLISSCTKYGPSASCGIPTGLATISTTGYSATLKWNSVSGANSYLMQCRIVGDSNWSGQGSSLTNSGVITNLYGNTNYEWQVQSLCSLGYSAFSASGTFRTGPPIGYASYDSLIYFIADSAVGSPSARSLTAYSGASSMAFVFSSYPISSGSYLVVAPGSSTAGNTVSMTAVLDSNTVNTSTGGDHVSAAVTVTAGKISLSLPRVETASTTNPSDSAPFYNIIINQQ